MKISKSQLKQIIKEELAAIGEANDTPLGSFLRQQPTEPLEYKDMPPEQQIELQKTTVQ